MTASTVSDRSGRVSTGVCDIPGVSQVCDTAGQAIAAPFEWLATGLAETAAWMYEAVWHVFDTTTLADVTAPGYLAVYNLSFGIGVVLALLLFCLQLLTGLLRREPDAMRRAALGLARSVLGSFLVITITAGLLEITDQLCLAIVHATGNTTDDMGARIAALILGLTALNLASPTVGTIVTMFLASLAIAAAATVWFSLLIRKALLLVAIVLAPIALSGQAWDATRSWLPRWAGFVLALIVSKLVTTVILLVAVTQASAPIDFDLASIAEPIAGIVLMFIAAFAPYLTYKFLAFTGLDTYHAISSEHEAKNAPDRPIPLPSPPRAGVIPAIVGGDPTPAADAAPTPTPDKAPDNSSASITPTDMSEVSPSGGSMGLDPSGHAEPATTGVTDTADAPASTTTGPTPTPDETGRASAEPPTTSADSPDDTETSAVATHPRPPDPSRTPVGMGSVATDAPEPAIESEPPPPVTASLPEPPGSDE